jgi:hypothetical protein
VPAIELGDLVPGTDPAIDSAHRARHTGGGVSGALTLHIPFLYTPWKFTTVLTPS